MRQNLRENGLLEDFLKQHPRNPASKYFPKEAATLAATEGLENYKDVSAGQVVWGCSSKDLAQRREEVSEVVEAGPGSKP